MIVNINEIGLEGVKNLKQHKESSGGGAMGWEKGMQQTKIFHKHNYKPRNITILTKSDRKHFPKNTQRELALKKTDQTTKQKKKGKKKQYENIIPQQTTKTDSTL